MSYYLVHHGIKGQSWGDRNGPPYPLDYNKHSSAEKKEMNKSDQTDKENKRKGLSDKQKKILKTTAKVVAVGAAVGATYYVTRELHKIGIYPVKDAVNKFKDNREYAKQRMKELDDILNAPFDPDEFSEFDDFFAKDLGGVANPKGYKNNCKDVAEATLKRWLGVDVSAVAGEKSMSGNLHDFINERLNKDGVEWINDIGGVSPVINKNKIDVNKTISRLEKVANKKFNEGDCGFIALTWDPKNLKLLSDKAKEDGHAFNWYIKNGKLLFFDDQPDPPITDVLKYFNNIDLNKEIEFVKITKKAFR